jgi:hypothetical protein
VGLPHDKVKEFAHVSSDRIFEHEEHGPVENLKISVGFIQAEVAKIAQAMQEGEYDRNTSSSTEEKVSWKDSHQMSLCNSAQSGNLLS